MEQPLEEEGENETVEREEDEVPERGLGVYPPGKAPFETGTPDQRYGLREFPMEPDSSEFAVWNVFTAFFGYFTAYCFGLNGRRSGGTIAQAAPHFIGFIRRIINDIRIIVAIPVRLFVIIWGWIVFVWGLMTTTYDVNIPIIATAIPVPLPVWIALYFVFLYLINAFWPLVLLFTVTVVIPFINLSLLVGAFVFNLTVITFRILFTIYNMNVPFLGIEIYFLLTIIFTTMEIVFDLIESSGIMELFQAFMEVIFFLIDMGMQCIMVFMQLQMSVLQIMAEVVSYILKLVMTVVEYVMAIVTWIIDYLFRIMEPILFIVQYIAQAFSWMMVSNSASAAATRKLLSLTKGMTQQQIMSLGLGSLVFSGGMLENGGMSPAGDFGLVKQDYVSFADTIFNQWMNETATFNMTESQKIEGMRGVRDFLDEVAGIRLDGRNDFNIIRDSFFSSMNKGVPDEWGTYVNSPESFGRKLMEVRDFKRSAGIENKEAPSEKEAGDGEDITMVDRTTEVFMRHFHSGVKNMVKDPYTNLDMMHKTMQMIRDHQNRGTDEYSIIAIMNEYEQEVGIRHGGLPVGPAHLRFVNHPEHPAELHNYFTEERKDYADRHGIPYTYAQYQEQAQTKGTDGATFHGRSLLEDVEEETSATSRKLMEAWTDVTRLHAEHLGRMEKDHAKQIAEQAKAYKTHHKKRVATISTLGHGLRKTLYEHGQTVLHPEVLSAHGQAIIGRFGYPSLKHVYEDYKKNYGSPEEFWLSLTDFRSNPFFKSFFHSYDRLNEHEHVKSWLDQFEEEEHLRVVEERPAADHFNAKRLEKVLGSDHRWVVGRYKNDGSRKLLASKNRLEGFEIIATTTCWGDPRNPLCMPDLSWIPIWTPSLISLPDEINDESNFCLPWEENTQIWSTRRLLNGWYSILFLLTVVPFVNYFFYSFTLVVPWMAWSVNWMFAVIPGGERASFEDIFCFVIHLYDFFVLILTYLFFRYIVYPLIDALVFRPIQMNITEHNQQYSIQQRALEMAENDPRFERAIRMQYAMLMEQDEVYRRRLMQLGVQRPSTTVINQGPETINNQIYIGAGIPHIDPLYHSSHQHYQDHMNAVINDPTFTAREHALLRRILWFIMNNGRHNQVDEYDPIAAELGRLGMEERMPPPPKQITHVQKEEA